MATVVVFDQFYYDMGSASHALGSDPYKVMLTNTLPNQATAATRGDIVEIAAGGGYTAGGESITMTWAETGSGTGVWQFGNASSDCVFTAASGNIGPFRYAVLYNATAASPETGQRLVAYLDYGSSETVLDGNTFTVDGGAAGFVRFTTPDA